MMDDEIIDLFEFFQCNSIICCYRIIIPLWILIIMNFIKSKTIFFLQSAALDFFIEFQRISCTHSKTEFKVHFATISISILSMKK